MIVVNLNNTAGGFHLARAYRAAIAAAKMPRSGGSLHRIRRTSGCRCHNSLLLSTETNLGLLDFETNRLRLCLSRFIASVFTAAEHKTSDDQTRFLGAKYHKMLLSRLGFAPDFAGELTVIPETT